MQDLLNMLKPALTKASTKFTGDLAADRNAVRDAIAGITNFTGLASGPISFVRMVHQSVEMVTKHQL